MLEYYDSILIGGSGLVGTRLGAHLAGTGERVLNLSRRQPGDSESGVDFTKIDFENQKETAGFILPRTGSLIILIGQIGPGFDPESDRRALRTIIELANAQTEPMKILYCSTALVYGNSDTPSRESDLIQPIEPYARHKAENEVFLMEHLASQHYLAILRLSNVYGDMRSRGFVSLVMNRLLEPLPEPFLLNGDGNQERDYIYIQDLVEAIAAVKKQLSDHDTVNIASGESHSLLSVIQIVQAVSGKKLPFVVTHKSVMEATKISISNERLLKKYGYAPRYSLEQGISLMWKSALAGNFE